MLSCSPAYHTIKVSAHHCSIQAQQQALTDQAPWQHIHKQPLENDTIDAAVIESCIQAREVSLKAGSKQQLDKRARRGIAGQGISEVEQSIGNPRETTIIQVMAEGVQN